MNRRDFLKAVGLGTAPFALAGCAGVGQAGRGPSKGRANVILIMADDLGCECLGCYGSTSYKTPRLDELARTGVRFDNCHSQPLCTPSRVQIMTGQYNFRNYKAFGILDPAERTFGHLMQSAGYATCVVGKWQLYGSSIELRQSRGKGALPGQVGFDEHCLWQIDRRESRYRNPLIVENGEYRKGLQGKYGPDVFCDYALDFIERHKYTPFFLYFPMALVHSPYVPTPDSKDWPRAEHKPNKKYFADMVAYMDRIVGRIVDKLDELWLRERTLILFTGDNGTGRGITSETVHGTVRGGKGTTTDAGTHVPLIANWTGVAPEQRVCQDLIDFSDFYPMMAELAGASMPEGKIIDGRSFLPQIRGRKGKPRKWVFCHYQRNPGDPLKRFVRDKRWKLYDDGRLFDLQADPAEKNPIAPGQDSAPAAKARKRLAPVLQRLR